MAEVDVSAIQNEEVLGYNAEVTEAAIATIKECSEAIDEAIRKLIKGCDTFTMECENHNPLGDVIKQAQEKELKNLESVTESINATAKMLEEHFEELDRLADASDFEI